MKKAVFFDKDGVLNKAIYRFDNFYNRMLDTAPLKTEELEINEHAKEIIEYVKSIGFLPIVITNQPDFLRMDLPLSNYEKLITKFCEELDLKRSQVFECLHFHKEKFSLGCECRKPKPGLFFMAKGMYDIDLESSWVIGDSWKDMQAAKEAKVGKIIFLKRDKIEGKQEGNEESIKKMREMGIESDYIINNLSEVNEIIK